MRKGSRSPTCKSHWIDLESYRSGRLRGRVGYGPWRQGSVGREIVLIYLCKLRIYLRSAALDLHLSPGRMNQTGKSFAAPPFSNILLTISSATRNCELRILHTVVIIDIAQIYEYINRAFLITTHSLWKERERSGDAGAAPQQIRTSALLSHVRMFPLLRTSARRLIPSIQIGDLRDRNRPRKKKMGFF